MTRFDYDIIVLGGGSAGIVSGVMAGALKMRVLVVEKHRMGGECLNTGCVPSKALLHAARVARLMRSAGEIGLKSAALQRADAAGVMAYVNRAIDRVRKADATDDLLRDNGAEIRHGDPQFVDPHTIAIDGERVTAASFILATGSRPALPEIPGLSVAGFRTNQSLFDLEAIPESLLVLGGGPVGVEMAQAFQLLGSRVTLVEKQDRLLPRDDAELARALERCLREDGPDIRLGAEVTSVRRQGDEIFATIASGGGPFEVSAQEMLVAIGRAPNIESLNLAAAGVAAEPGRIPVDAAFRTSAPHIYACGDLLGEYQFSHMAEVEAKTVVRNIVFPGVSREAFRVAPWTTFTDPEVAGVGLTEAEAAKRGISVDVLRQPFAQDDRAIVENEERGFVKVLTHGSAGEIVGAHIIGARAGELIQEWVFAIQQRRSIRDIADMVHVYPTLTMASQHAAQRWYERKAKEPLVDAALTTYVKRVRPHQTALALGVAGAGLLGAGLAALSLRRRRRG